jgi:hypothetical protein
MPGAASIPVIVMSAATNLDDELFASCTVVQKPVSSVDLVASIERARQGG